MTPFSVILALDLGTTGNRAIAFNQNGRILASAYQEFPQLFPKPAWVEQNPEEIWRTAFEVLQTVIQQVQTENVAALGITNQRETTILWDRQTGAPVYNAIVWQDRRTTPDCEALKGHLKEIKHKTGLFIDPYFSATKIKWILKNVNGISSAIDKGNILFGTVDTWLIWKLTKGTSHTTDSSNASRTLLFNLHSCQFDNDLLLLFDVPKSLLPEIKESASDFGYVHPSFFGRSIPIKGVLGDQQAALFAHGGWRKGIIKNTYGTGLFVAACTHEDIPESGKLVNTVGWSMNGKTEYAIEGPVFCGGSAIQWLRDELRLFAHAEESAALAQSLSSNDDVYFVPALTGLGAPYWDPSARGLLIGITRGTSRKHIARAVLESLAYQTYDVIEEMRALFSHFSFDRLCVDGGAAKNDFLMQFQSDILGIPVERPVILETTAFGVAGIAGIKAGIWDFNSFLGIRIIEKTFYPKMASSERSGLYEQWKRAVERGLGWAKQGKMTEKTVLK